LKRSIYIDYLIDFSEILKYRKKTLDKKPPTVIVDHNTEIVGVNKEKKELLCTSLTTQSRYMSN